MSMLTLAAAAAFAVLATGVSEADCAAGVGQCAASADHSLIQSKSLISSSKKLAAKEGENTDDEKEDSAQEGHKEQEGQKTDGDKEDSAQEEQEGGHKAKKAEAKAKLEAKHAEAKAKLQAKLKDAKVVARKARIASKRAKKQGAKDQEEWGFFDKIWKHPGLNSLKVAALDPARNFVTKALDPVTEEEHAQRMAQEEQENTERNVAEQAKETEEEQVETQQLAEEEQVEKQRIAAEEVEKQKLAEQERESQRIAADEAERQQIAGREQAVEAKEEQDRVRLEEQQP